MLYKPVMQSVPIAFSVQVRIY